MARRPRILAVDDQAQNLELIGAILEEEDCEVEFATDGVAALEAVERHAPDAVLLDVMMPRLDGFEVCRRLKQSRATCFVPVILLTALADIDSKVRGLESGADDFLNKPFHRIELLTRLRSLLRIRALRDELDSTESVIFSLVDLLEGKDPRTRHHSLRVAALVGEMARRLELEPRTRQDLVWAALLHDVGKLGVAEATLLTPEEERNDEERAAYRSHTILGSRILAPIQSLEPAIELLSLHHERVDGSGYPSGLAGEEVPRDAELLAVANRLDHLRAGREADRAGWAARLLGEAAAGKFREATVHEALAAARAIADEPRLGDLLPIPIPRSGGTILVADDSSTNRQLYRELLEGAGYRVHLVAGGAEALAAWREIQPDLLLLDVRMPGVGGAEVCHRVKSAPDATWRPVILVTAYEQRESRRRAVQAGADDLLLAPVNRTELLARVRSLLRLRMFHHDLVGHESVVLSLSAALEAKDAYTRGHSARVGELSARLALELGHDPAAADQLHRGGLLHDIGKVAVPEALLRKPGKLTPQEFRTVMAHPRVGWEICRRLRSAEPVLDVIRYHHERFDGRGYPDGLVGDEIPRQARILSVADALDALTSERPYRRSLSIADAMELLGRETRLGKWDPDVFLALQSLHSRGETDLRNEPPAETPKAFDPMPSPYPDRVPRSGA